jgi:hypothetical protein
MKTPYMCYDDATLDKIPRMLARLKFDEANVVYGEYSIEYKLYWTQVKRKKLVLTLVLPLDGTPEGKKLADLVHGKVIARLNVGRTT